MFATKIYCFFQLVTPLTAGERGFWTTAQIHTHKRKFEDEDVECAILEPRVKHPDCPMDVYVRQAYIDILYDSYIANTKHTLVMGSPGTGKSVFLLYVAYRI